MYEWTLLLHSTCVTCIFLCLAPEDYTAINGTLQMSEDALVQCVPIPISLDNVEEPEEECFTYSILSPSEVAGLTLNPNETTICITDKEGNLRFKQVASPVQHRWEHYSLLTEVLVVVPQPGLYLQQRLYSVSEADGSVEVCVEVTTRQFEGSIQVNYSTVGGSAEGLCLRTTAFPSSCWCWTIALSVYCTTISYSCKGLC